MPQLPSRALFITLFQIMRLPSLPFLPQQKTLPAKCIYCRSAEWKSPLLSTGMGQPSP